MHDGAASERVRVVRWKTAQCSYIQHFESARDATNALQRSEMRIANLAVSVA